MQSTRNESTSKQYCVRPSQGIKVFWFLGAIKLLAYFSMVKIPLRSLIVASTTASSRLNTWHIISPSLPSATFSIWSKMSLISTVLLLPWKVLSVLKRVHIYSQKFFVKNISGLHTCKKKLMRHAIYYC